MHPLPRNGATSYLEKYRDDPDFLQGNYQDLYRRHDVNTGEAAAQLSQRLPRDSQEIPKMFLFLAQLPGGGSRVECLHRVTEYPRNALAASPWDDGVFCFLKDILPGGFIKTARLPADPFELTPVATVPTIGDVVAQLAANPVVNVLPPYTTGAVNTEDLATFGFVLRDLS
jgi:hypothetical protein